MKTIKTNLLLTVLLFATLCTCAQTFSLKAGYNLSNIQQKSEDMPMFPFEYKSISGFHVGGFLEMPINDLFTIESGLQFSSKGSKMELSMNDAYSIGGDIGIELLINSYYLDIPITLKATHQLNDNLALFANAGPYIGIGLTGKLKSTLSFMGQEESEEEDIEWGQNEDTDVFRRLDMGLTFGGGVQMKAFLIGLSYDLGLLNINTTQEGYSSRKNKVFKISVGYHFGK